MLNPSMSYAVELDGELSFCSKGRLQPLASLKQLKGDCRVLTDFQDAISRTMTVEADTRYVELMISRKLQETGEFEEPVTVVSHWKKKRGKNTSDIYFTAVPAKRYFQYLELVGEYKDHLVLLPLQSALLTVLKKYSKARPVAVVFRHGRFADVLVGTPRKIWYANRVVAFDESREQIDAMWETVRADIDTAANDHHQTVEKVYAATWIDCGPLPEWTGPGDPEIIPLDEHAMTLDGREVRASLPHILHRIPVGQSMAAFKDRLFYGARRLIPALNLLLLLGALVMGGIGMGYQFQSSGLEEKIQTGLRQAQVMRDGVPENIQPVAYKETLDFVQRLWTCRQLPTYGQILADVGQGDGGILRVENIKVDYAEDKVDVKVFGVAQAPFEASYKAYRDLRQRLRQRGYRMVGDRFDTRINTSHFVIEFAKEAR